MPFLAHSVNLSQPADSEKVWQTWPQLPQGFMIFHKLLKYFMAKDSEV